MFRYLFLLSMLILPNLTFTPAAHASTFIGNGGNLLDTTLRSTINAIAAANDRARMAGDSLCACKGNSKQCGQLQELSEQQVEFCAGFIQEHTADLDKLLSPNSGVSFIWIEKGITERESKRPADALTQRQKKRILIDEERFRDLSSADRIQLLTHEYFHLLRWNGRDIIDSGEMGPFTGQDGARHFLDVLGAAYVIEAMRAEVIPLQSSDYSSPFYHFRVGLSYGTQKESDSVKARSFVSEDTDVTNLSLSYYRRASSNFGLALRYLNESATSNTGGVTGSIEREVGYLGIEWRSMLIGGEPDSWWSLVHYTVMIGAGGGTMKHKISDNFNTFDEGSKGYGGYLEANLHVPLKFGLFANIGASLEYLPYQLKTLGIKKKKPTKSTLLGVSYGF